MVGEYQLNVDVRAKTRSRHLPPSSILLTSAFLHLWTCTHPLFNDPTEIAARRDPEIEPCKRYGESEPVFY
jgi:hypothetical protein